ncbi:MAG: hypothetical protein MN733_02615 [Nitrososphaera sp.]|nr:hypothetical protein [Nitrososphaera sp.]
MINITSTYPFTLLSFLELLSVERTEQFISELGIEIERESNVNVMRYTRACLEIYIYIAMCEGLADSPDLPQSWDHYHATDGVLRNDELKMRAQELKGCAAHERLHLLCKSYRHMVGEKIGGVLDKWFEEIYVPANNGFSILALTIFKLIHPKSRFRSATRRIPLVEDERNYVIRFCDNYYDKQSQISERFTGLNREAVLEGPSAWEAVLQTLPADSKAGDNYPWLFHISECLIFRVFLSEAKHLRENLGASAMERFIKWARFEADRRLGEKDLPFDLILQER